MLAIHLLNSQWLIGAVEGKGTNVHTGCSSGHFSTTTPPGVSWGVGEPSTGLPVPPNMWEKQQKVFPEVFLFSRLEAQGVLAEVSPTPPPPRHPGPQGWRLLSANAPFQPWQQHDPGDHLQCYQLPYRNLESTRVKCLWPRGNFTIYKNALHHQMHQMKWLESTKVCAAVNLLFFEVPHDSWW